MKKASGLVVALLVAVGAGLAGVIIYNKNLMELGGKQSEQREV